ncbi:hypothetical protein NDN08_004048 [Rhodosorus marinus]|uniref:TLC domain-containing protein n=1 Tax=Rhodosorus marinus TaxID=101924 RepID=A0AAV8UJU3_9RHOD|nr:hypothetical protein NDN08_004048 [Rhodosorus marinus]
MDSRPVHNELHVRSLVWRVLGGQVLGFLEVLYFFIGVGLLGMLISQHVSFVKYGACDAEVAEAITALSGEAQILELRVNRNLSKAEKRGEDGRIEDSTAFRFSTDRRLLLVPREQISGSQIGLHEVVIEPDSQCFGSFASKSLIKYVLGHEVILLNVFRRAVEKEKMRGYLYGYSDHKLYPLEPPADNNWWSVYRGKFAACVTSLFLMHTMSGLITFSLRHIQVRILKLSVDLRAYMLSQISCSALEVIVHYALDAIVFVPIITGVLYFLREFFEDLFFSFMVVLVAWMREVVLLVNARHWANEKRLQQLLSAYFFTFHLYFFCFPMGYSWLALFTCTLFMQHAVIMTWNRSIRRHSIYASNVNALSPLHLL